MATPETQLSVNVVPQQRQQHVVTAQQSHRFVGQLQGRGLLRLHRHRL